MLALLENLKFWRAFRSLRLSNHFQSHPDRCIALAHVKTIRYTEKVMGALFMNSIARPALLILIIVSLAACGGARLGGDEDAEESEILEDGVDAAQEAADDAEREESEEGGIDREKPSITRLAPDHGPFTGGTQVMVIGRGFEDGAVVYFGEHRVQLPETRFVDEYRIQVHTPAGSPGRVDVKVVTGGEEAVLEEGFTYDVFHVDPPDGSVAGGTYVEITGHDTGFQAGSMITFDGEEASDVDWVSETKMTCRTPPGAPGPANVVIDGPDDDFEAKEAYEYYDGADPVNGGLSGGPMDGAVNVTILDSTCKEPVQDAFCILGSGGDTVFQGNTNAAGRITFSGPGLTGRRTITAAKEGFESTTIEKVDARDVTIFLMPVSLCGCPVPPSRSGATIHGELVFEHAGEPGPGPWEIVPEPGPNEEKVAHVYATGYDIQGPPPDPGLGGAGPVVNYDMDNASEHGFPFSVHTRSESVAVWAVAGLQNLETADFVPYAFGIARGIIAGPGEDVEGILVPMTHELNQPVAIEARGHVPPLDPFTGPDIYKCEIFIDLGSDGIIFRDDRSILREDSLDFFSPGWLPLRYELADASYAVMLGAYTRLYDELTGVTVYTNPFSVRIIRNITHLREPVIVEDLIGIPYPVDPAWGSRMSGMHMEFGNNGPAPEFWLVMLQTYPDQSPIWKIFIPGSQTEYDLPDLALIAGLPWPPPGFAVWIVWGISADGFNYDELSYKYLNNDTWSAYAADSFIFEF